MDKLEKNKYHQKRAELFKLYDSHYECKPERTPLTSSPFIASEVEK
mgnify:CR=1 FL=1